MRLTIPLKVVPIGGVTPRPSTNPKPGDLQIRTAQFHLILIRRFQSSKILGSNGSDSVNSRVAAENRETRNTAHVHSHGWLKPQPRKPHNA